jgi:hypothetical protein
MSSSKELRKNTIEQLNLAGGADEFVVDEAAGVHFVLDALEEEWVLTYLAELHQFTGQSLDPTFPTSERKSVSHKAENLNPATRTRSWCCRPQSSYVSSSAYTSDSAARSCGL